MTKPLPAAALKQWMDDTTRDAPFILDVREPWEYDICSIPGAQLLPMENIPARWRELPRERDIVVVCHHGMRSLQVANYLVNAGLQRVYNLNGGVAAWADHVDVSMPKY